MVSETNFENSVVNHFVDKLGYEKDSPSVFNRHTMVLENAIERFLMETQPKKCKNFISKDYDGDKKLFFKDISKAISDYVYFYNKDNANGSLNVPIQLGKNSLFKFKGVAFTLYYPFGIKDIDKNIYTVVPQINFSIKGFHKSLPIIPDIGVFVNGILFSYIQLKIKHRGQSADNQGRGQVIGDYLETVKFGVTDHLQNYTISDNNDERYALIQQNLKYFHSPAHIVTMDMNDAYVIRGISKHYKEAENLYLSNKTDDLSIKNEIRKAFLKDTVHIKESHLDAQTRTEKVLYNLYSKNTIQNEILYFNFIGYEKKSEYIKGKKEVSNKTNISVLNYPRPNQKYGVEKTVAEVIRKYKNENNPNYEIERLVQQLDNLGVPDNVKRAVIEKRRSYKNNQNQFSLLLQYAAGFGKTYILCWLALMLKDLENLGSQLKNDFLLDKIFIISDRVDLRDQIDRSMHSMNIDKSLFKEVCTKEELKKSLTEISSRIVIVNIQKFTHFNDMLGDDDRHLLKGKRVAFLIDEIHRSNSGSQHHSMTNLFDEVVDSVSMDGDKKNLIIGLTATPTDENLARFGEYQGCTEDLKWTPFDSYTMSEAIQDGFVLDPTKNIIPFAVKLDFAVEDERKIPTKKEIYEFRDRIIMNAKHMSHILLDTTFKKIKGNGKAMLCCYSIESALAYYDALREEIDNITRSNEKYAPYKNVGIYIVYSSTQEQTPAHVHCGFNNEKETISAFKNNKNGLMIVVDKLQTGFDEPRLHTLLLDKEINDINAVQTVCRTNRTMKGKEDCLVVDFSIDNVNLSNIESAFLKFSGVVVSTLDSFRIKQFIETMYKNIIKTEYYSIFFSRYKKEPESMDIAYEIQNFIDEKFRTEKGIQDIVITGEFFLEFLSKLGIVRTIIDLEKKYTDSILISFLRELLNIARSKFDCGNNRYREVVDFIVDSVGTIERSKIQRDELKNKKTESSKFRISNDDDNYNILAKIREMNKKENNKEFLILEYKEKMFIFFNKIIELNNKKEGLLLDDIDSNTKSAEFEKFFKMTIRRIKDNPEMFSFVNDIENNPSLMESDFYLYVKKTKNKIT